ncbi:uncharacterized protein AKAME5_001469200 [Lates japonicus]|uniref:Uncharacterized protein n=1 Tax=Lates japonicus TaxID=270547 RepID=A0AAD3MZH4_LATJO|nr:uncharacterized protein AKAME5_001469200 [Lates japonicus]
MMKTLCVAVVVLSLTSVSQSASLACERLLKPVDKGPDLSGRWYVKAMSSDICVAPVVYTLWPSIAVDITSKDIPNIYQFDFKMNMYGYCHNHSSTLFFDGTNTIFDVESNNAPTNVQNVLLQSGCPDCLVMKGWTTINTLMLYSKENRGIK